MVSDSAASGANVSLASTSSTLGGLFRFTVKLSLTASGGSFTGVTVTVTVAVAVPPLPSEIVYVNVVVPKKLLAGRNLATTPSWVTVPLAGWVTAMMVSVSPVSGANESLARTLSGVVPLSSATVKVSALAVGGLLPTVTVTVAVS